MQKKDFLFELLTEELPPKNLKRLSDSLSNSVMQSLQEVGLDYEGIRAFATPRRLALIIDQLALEQPEQTIERQGPALKIAYDAQGKPTKAGLGFAKSCGVSFDQIKKLETEKGAWLYFKAKKPGKTAAELLPVMIEKALSQLPVGKMMRWGDLDVEFVRPVHHVIMLLGNQVIDANFFHCQSNQKTRGHRFLSSGDFMVAQPSDYESTLKKHFVIADFDSRRSEIRKQIDTLAKERQATAIVHEDLLNEVTALVEWPVALLAEFSYSFLALPKEVIIASVQKHQKCFLLENEDGELLPYFITISNMQATDASQIIEGNQRVMSARLNDAEFFYHADLKQHLELKTLQLETVLFQKRLGSLLDKTKRVVELSQVIAKKIGADTQKAERAAFLCKADLTTEMVGEFPELQGIIGDYYARHNKESGTVATAIREHYMPTHANASLPTTLEGCSVALSDRIDTLIGIFGINKKPTGDKDPFGLRRAALGIIRLIIEKKLTLNLLPLLKSARAAYDDNHLVNERVVEDVYEFILERLKYWSIDQEGFSAQVFLSVHAVANDDLLDFYHRMQAVSAFQDWEDSVNLIAAHKRVNNLLAKGSIDQQTIQTDLLIDSHEKQLVAVILDKQKATGSLVATGDYLEILKTLSTIREVVDTFFEQVMVMAEDKAVRQNRLAILFQLKQLFLQVADIGLL